MSLEQKLVDRSARLGVIGLGYVGLPLAIEFARAGFEVVGIDIDQSKVDMLGRGESYIKDVPAEHLAEAINSGKFRATTDFSALAEVDTIDICVPTPLSKTRDPDISYIDAAAEEICRYQQPGQLIVLESTTYPGTTEEVILPRLSANGAVAGKDFYLAFSPERVDPGNQDFNTKNIPKVVGGVTPECTRMAKLLYEQTLTTVVPVSSAAVAETVKLLENTFRSVNIGLVNEIAQLCQKMDIDVWEVIRAAATKPFGFMPFFPGPGLGGHCIPIDPFYLSWKARASGFEARFIELAGVVNGGMPAFVVDLVARALNDLGKSVRGSRILICGIAYKKNIDDVRESPALDILSLLEERGGELSWFDPWVDSLRDYEQVSRVEDLSPATLAEFDCAVIVTAHENVDYGVLVEHLPRIVDTRDALNGIKSDKIIRL
ncbi:UDP-N-acetyl-D-glucosamine dehydrogenase [bacterium]|nr:MAG: UDP-N-acetyl-D-glucosamine dehydrogenase [bacterium]RKZ16870.1 MAG: UDP-N-acetyl-D-glucosamine dehydrogenase [bacterium]